MCWAGFKKYLQAYILTYLVDRSWPFYDEGLSTLHKMRLGWKYRGLGLDLESLNIRIKMLRNFLQAIILHQIYVSKFIMSYLFQITWVFPTNELFWSFVIGLICIPFIKQALRVHEYIAYFQLKHFDFDFGNIFIVWVLKCILFCISGKRNEKIFFSWPWKQIY